MQIGGGHQVMGVAGSEMTGELVHGMETKLTRDSENLSVPSKIVSNHCCII